MQRMASLEIVPSTHSPRASRRGRKPCASLKEFALKIPPKKSRSRNCLEMCQQIDTASRMQELYQQGMPRRIGKRVERRLLQQQKVCADKNCENNQKRSEEQEEELGDSDEIMECPVMKIRMKMAAAGGDAEVLKIKSSDDLLAVFTKVSVIAYRQVTAALRRAQESNTYKVLSGTTQPAHVIAVAILSFVVLAVWPSLLTSSRNAKENERKSVLALLVYLAAFATHFGAQIWMTFVSGLALYFSLPRHTFGLCQQILFPKYFALNSILSICTLVTYVHQLGGRWEFASCVQVVALATCAVIEVTVRLYLAPPLLHLMREKHKFESAVGSGQEVGFLNQGDLVKCPRYQKIHKSFRRIHMLVAMGNLTVLVCSCLHLHYLASRISVS